MKSERRKVGRSTLLIIFILSTCSQVFAQSYCSPSHYGATFGNCVASVTIGSWTQSNAGGDGSINDYTGGTDAAMTQGSSYNFSVTFTKVAQSYYGFVYVDWNDDGDFSDASETVQSYTTVGSGSGSTVWTNATYTCPSIATGTVRMRVISSVYTNYGPCGAWDYGEWEDYEIVVSAAPNVKANNTTNLNA